VEQASGEVDATDVGEVEELADEAAAASSSTAHILVDLSVAFSPTFRVPVLYFQAREICAPTPLLKSCLTNKVAGSPVPLERLFHSTTFTSRRARQEYPLAQLGSQMESFPSVSQGEHPITGHPSYFLHPCETEAMLAEIGSAEDTASTWLMLVGTVVDLRGGVQTADMI
jgi:ubiquitin-like-conjugating enzyme ATG10